MGGSDLLEPPKEPLRKRRCNWCGKYVGVGHPAAAVEVLVVGSARPGGLPLRLMVMGSGMLVPCAGQVVGFNVKGPWMG